MHLELNRVSAWPVSLEICCLIPFIQSLNEWVSWSLRLSFRESVSQSVSKWVSHTASVALFALLLALLIRAVGCECSVLSVWCSVHGARCWVLGAPLLSCSTCGFSALSAQLSLRCVNALLWSAGGVQRSKSRSRSFNRPKVLNSVSQSSRQNRNKLVKINIY